MLRLFPILLFTLVQTCFASAQSFEKEDIKAFSEVMNAIEDSALFEDEIAAADRFSLSSLNPLDGMGDMMTAMLTGGDGSEWDGLISPSGEIVTMRLVAAGMSYSQPEQQMALETIVTDAGFDSIEDWASKSDAILSAMFAETLRPIIDQIPVRRGEAVSKRIKEKARELLKEEAARLAKAEITKLAIRAVLQGLGADIAGEITLGPSGQDLKKSLERIFDDIVTDVAGNGFGMSEASLQRLAVIVAVTPPEDIALLKANKRLLPRDMRDFDEPMDMD